ncbi:MAG: redoxin domain-containing protein [Solirubrobacteraceae bacterium]
MISAVGSGVAARARVVALVALAIVVVGAAIAPRARADGDPGSDVLVNQDLFVAGDAGVSVAQQAQLGDLLQAAGAAGLPVRVAIIAHPADLGAVTALWLKPQAYASFLGIELSLAYKQRLLVVMPDGFGLNWPGHSTVAAGRLLGATPVRSGATGLVDAAQSAVRSLAGSAGVRIAGAGPARSAASPSPAASVAPSAGGAGGAGGAAGAAGAAGGGRAGAAGEAPIILGSGSSANPGQRTDDRVAMAVAILAALAVAAFAGRRALARRRARPARRRHAPLSLRRAVPGVALLFGVAAAAPIVVLAVVRASNPSPSLALARNPYVDPGTALAGAAPDFTLSDQFGRPVSLRSFRGKVVMLAFTDSECTTICPMTTTAMLDAKAMLGPAASRVQLLGVDANPASISLEDVSSYSQLHGMVHQWHFLTGSLPALKRVWKDYAVYADIQHGLIAHTPALYIISPQGIKAKVYITQQSYSAVGQLGEVLAREASSLLPGHPAVHANLSFAPIPAIGPSERVSLPRTGGGRVTLGPGPAPRLYVFFATWDREVTGLAGHLQSLDDYQAAADARRLPALTAVDEGTVEPSPAALPDFLRTLGRPLAYPVAIDATGRVADGYEVQGEPWFVLTSAGGRILWYQEVSTSGWPSDGALERAVRSALARAPQAPTTARAIAQDLAGAPAPLAALHAQAGRLLGAAPALTSRIKALRGYPIVINAWASWCTACRAEFGLFAGASAAYGRRVAFLGVDTNDSPGDAQAFLAQHPVGYPSYQANSSDLAPLAAIEGLPTTIFINPAGKVVFVHTGQYYSEGSLDGDVGSRALGS